MKKLLYLLVLVLAFNTAHSQNLIGNPSFEEINEITTSWSGTFSKFNRRIKGWNSPTQGSPDILYINSLDKMVPPRPKVDLTKHSPRTGDFMIGIKTYGCRSRTLHCKEYLQIQLKEPLQNGEKYYFEYWVIPIKTSVKVNSFGLAVSNIKVEEIMVSGLIDMYPVAMHDDIVDGDSAQWHRISGVFEADDNYEHIIIGNFSPDKSIDFKEEKDGLNYGYYLLDDVMLRPLYSKASSILIPNENIVMDNILFEFDKADIQASSNAQLNEIVSYLKTNPNFLLEIMGHTDSKGSPKHNLELSQKRADAIKDYLIQKEIEASRIKPIGLGSKYPIVENDSEENQQLNRRVEIKIIEK